MLRFWPIVLWLLYFFFPYDLVPDFIPGIGRLDDLLLLIFLFWSSLRNVWMRSSGMDDETHSDAQSNPYGHAWHQRPGDYEREEPRVHRKPAKDPYQILGVSRSATVDDIKKAYRVQANRYHPDKVSHLGEEFQTIATEKFQEIQWAYEALLKERGEL